MTTRVSAPWRDHAGLDRHRRRADRPLTARNVVATGVDEEQPELRAGRDGLGHDRDEQSPMTARLQAEPGPEVIEVLLAPPALLRDGGAGQAPEAGREQPHPDAGRVEGD